MGYNMGLKDKIRGLTEFAKARKQLTEATERIFPKIDDEMYMIAQSLKTQKEKDEAQRVLAIFIVAELIDSFEAEDQKKILDSLMKTIKE